MLYVTSICVLVRNIYRIVEFMMGQQGFLLEHEWPLYVFDGSLMILVMVGFFIWYPAHLQPSSRESMVELMSANSVEGERSTARRVLERHPVKQRWQVGCVDTRHE